MRVPVLAYHAINVSGNDYASNDHVAFAADLRLINDLGLRIVPLQWIVDQLTGLADRDLSRCVALTCDDGSALDFFDLEYPDHGLQRSLYHCMLDFIAERGPAAQPDLHLTSFVIASPQARQRMDASSLFGRGWMGDDWWRHAANCGMLAIENHSWDHNHPCLPAPGCDGMPRGSFLDVNNLARADAEIAAATRFINERIAPKQTKIFCYPFSNVADYLRNEYFPQFTHAHGMLAAMGDGATPVTVDSDRWNLPRYICGWHWKSAAGLLGILQASG